MIAGAESLVVDYLSSSLVLVELVGAGGLAVYTH